MKELLTKVVLCLVTLFAVAACGGSTDQFVYSGLPEPSTGNPGGHLLFLTVAVPSRVTGARPIASLPSTISSAPSDFTLPGALCRAYDLSGQLVATAVVTADGVVRLKNLPSGSYRIVITNQDSAVLLQALGRSSADGPTLAEVDSSSTAAVLVSLALGKGQLGEDTYLKSAALDLSELVSEVEFQIARPGSVWITGDGKTVTDLNVKRVVAEATQALP